MEETLTVSACIKPITCIFLLFLSLTSHAQELSDFIELNSLHFGDISAEIGSTCVMDTNGNISGDCDASSPDISLGLVHIENLPKNSEFLMTISGSSSANLSLDVAGEVTAASTTTFTNGEQIQIRSRGNNRTAEITIAGELSVSQTLTSQQSYDVSYTVTIDIQ